ncbi:MAG: DUF1538 domain-containing protein [Clostridia bacterium]|nr:DUF1538 domain-containing protein [Clostridia bacterium]
MKLWRTLKDTFISSLPLAVVIAVCLIVAPLPDPSNYGRIVVGYVGVIVGQALFLVGLDVSILPIGRMVGGTFAKYNKLIFVLLFGFIFGLFATVAEPALSVLAKQISALQPLVNNTLFIWITGAGIGFGVALALLRIAKNINMKILFAALYVLVFLLVIFAPGEFVSLAFDGSGATTGDVSVPFILALSIGVSATFSKGKTNEDSFGIIGISSIGPIVAVLVYGIILKAVHGPLPSSPEMDMGASASFVDVLLNNLWGVALAVLPIVIISIPVLLAVVKIPKRAFGKLMLGVLPVYLGLLIFMCGIDFGFSFVGQYMGQIFFAEGSPDWLPWLLPAVGFVLGAAITVSEPAVTVLGEQIEALTNGHIKKTTIRLTLALGIGVAALLSILKILTSVNILWFLVPLYAVALVMMIFTPKLFVGLAFDSGGVTGGALTSAFLTPLTLSVAAQVAAINGIEGSVIEMGFGIISFISVTPLIAVQALGILYKAKTKKLESAQREESFAALASFVTECESGESLLVETPVAACATCAQMAADKEEITTPSMEDSGGNPWVEVPVGACAIRAQTAAEEQKSTENAAAEKEECGDNPPEEDGHE